MNEVRYKICMLLSKHKVPVPTGMIALGTLLIDTFGDADKASEFLYQLEEEILEKEHEPVEES